MVDDSVELCSERMDFRDIAGAFEARDDLAESFDDRSLCGFDEVCRGHALDHADYFEVVAQDARVEISDVDPLMRRHDDESIAGHADECLADWYATDPEFDREGVDIDAVAWTEPSVEDALAEELGDCFGGCLAS